jgi:hypothetical protein
VDTTSRILSDSKLELKEYEDHESGGTADRPQFQAMMAAAAQRQFDLVLFWSLDRFTREVRCKTLQHLNKFCYLRDRISLVYRAIPRFLWDLQRSGNCNPWDNRQTGESADLSTSSRRVGSSSIAWNKEWQTNRPAQNHISA